MTWPLLPRPGSRLRRGIDEMSPELEQFLISWELAARSGRCSSLTTAEVIVVKLYDEFRLHYQEGTMGDQRSGGGGGESIGMNIPKDHVLPIQGVLKNHLDELPGATRTWLEKDVLNLGEGKGGQGGAGGGTMSSNR